MSLWDSIKGTATGAWDSVSHTAHDVMDGGAKYLTGIPGVLMHGAEHVAEEGAKASPLGMIWSGLKAGGHTVAGAYDAITGNREGAVEHGSEAVMNALGMIPGLGHIFHGAEAAGNLVLGGANAARGDGGAMPTVGEAVGGGVNGLIDLIPGMKEETKEIGPDGKPVPKKTSTAQGVLGTLGAIAGLTPLGIPGAILGGGIGRALGGLFGGGGE